MRELNLGIVITEDKSSYKYPWTDWPFDNSIMPNIFDVKLAKKYTVIAFEPKIIAGFPQVEWPRTSAI